VFRFSGLNLRSGAVSRKNIPKPVNIPTENPRIMIKGYVAGSDRSFPLSLSNESALINKGFVASLR
jgi:hypothetical protein